MKRPLERSKSIWEDYIRINFKEIAVIAKKWIKPKEHWRTLVNVTLNLRIP